MEEEKLQENQETKENAFVTSNGETINVPPEVLLESIDDVDKMISGHIAILEGVREVIHRGVAHGMTHDDSAKLAFELHKRASAKANTMVEHTGTNKEEK